MEIIALHEMGEIIRKVRKERGLRLEDLADRNISPATVSNIERGVAHVSPEKITYLLKKLDLPLDEIPEILKKDQEEIRKTNLQLISVFSLCNLGQIEEASKLLKQLKLEESHPYAAKLYFAKGLIFLRKKKWKQAERRFQHALRVSQNNNSSSDANFEAYIYLQISKCYEGYGDLSHSIYWIDQGIDCYQNYQGHKKHWSRLICQKALYFYQQEMFLEGFRWIEENWTDLENCPEEEVRYTSSWLKGEFLHKLGKDEEALRHTTTLLSQANDSHFPDLLCKTWTLLGKLYTHKRKFELAQLSFHMALQYKSLLKDEQTLLSTYLELGYFYKQQHQLTKAYTYYQDAMKLAKKYASDEEHLQILLIMGQLCHHIESKKEEAITLLEQALKRAQKLNKTNLEREIWLALAQCYEAEKEEAFIHCLRKAFELKKSTT